MGEIVTLPGDRHNETQMLLPWYVNGTLDHAERMIVDAHLAECGACREDLESERRLAHAVAAGVSRADFEWSRLEAQLTPPAASRSWSRSPRRAWASARQPGRPSRMGWIVAGQAAAIVAMAIFLLPGRTERPAEYRALGAAPAEHHGNVLAMFRPEMSEKDLRDLLKRSGARVVDGPTDADAYVLEVPGGASGRALAMLRKDGDVTMAEPIAQAPAE